MNARPTPPKVVVFYAYKGGAGRSTALLHTAWALAREGRRIVTLDLDLMAPSLGAMTGLAPDDGFVEYLRAWQQGEAVDVAAMLAEVRLPSPASGSLYLLHAGHEDARYLETLESLRWRDLLASRPPRSRPARNLWDRVHVFDELLESVTDAVRPEAIFIDAPTGFNETANLVLRSVADLVILLFSPTSVHLQGAARLLSVLTSEQAARAESDPEPRPDVFCVASTILLPQLGGPEFRTIQKSFEYLDSVRTGALQRARSSAASPQADELHQEPALLQHDPRSVYGERLFEHDRSDFSAFGDIIQYVRGALPPTNGLRLTQLERPAKTTMARQLEPTFVAFAEHELVDTAQIDRLFLKTQQLEEVYTPRVLVVEGGKGAGKTALFKYLTTHDVPKARVFAVHGPGHGLAPDFLLRIQDLQKMDVFWRMYALSALPGDDVADVELIRAVHACRRLVSNPGVPGELDAIAQFLRREDAGVTLDAALRTLDSRLAQTDVRYILCFDGLDAAFKKDIERRREGLADLFMAWRATFSSTPRIELRIFLRSDLWNRLIFPERSHLRGREMRLVWDELNLWRLVVKRALRVEQFAGWARPGLADSPALDADTIENVGETRLEPYLDRLFERHIWAGKNALSKNWIRRRLSDAQGAIYPRDIVSLLGESLKAEQRRLEQDERFAPDAVISRQSLAAALRPTSEQRVQAVREEYPELSSALDDLAGKSTRGFIKDLTEAIGAPTLEQLRDTGILKIGEADDEYVIPDLYRDGLGMYRRGPH
jgi:MinD-like ATPase involved in chromosome partitioning or flagellar assembly